MDSPLTETLVTGKATFKLQVPYKLVRSGENGQKPLIIYLHGYGQGIHDFERKMNAFLELDAYHLFIQGPYPLKLNPKDHKRSGYSYYIYDEQDESSYIRSIEYTAEFIQEIVDHILPIIKASRISMLGYSMGAYLAGYWGCTRWKHTNDIIMLNGRLKAELFTSKVEEQKVLRHINFVAFNGKNDTIVDPKKQKEMMDYLANHHIKAEFHEVETGHALTESLIHATINWMLDLGFRKVKN